MHLTGAFFMATKVKIPKFYTQLKPYKIKRSKFKMPKLPSLRVSRIKI